MKESLLQKLTEYASTMIPFHMPGHKRVLKDSLIPYSIDITEVEGFDNLHDMKGVLKVTANLAKQLYSSRESYPLVNGSTCGVLSGLYALTRGNKNILIARNCHKSVYNAVEILDLDARYILPEMDALGVWKKITPQAVEEELKSHDTGVVVITSPTYEGVISDVSAIYQVCKKYGALLFVDSAHGAHFVDKPMDCDISVMSLHKTLPSLTQTAVLNVYSDRVDLDTVSHGLSIFETSSPSYILLASIDECLRYALKSKEDNAVFYKNLEEFYEETKALKNIKVTHFDDAGKIIIAAKEAEFLADLLRKEKIETEMVSDNFILAFATIADTKESLKALSKALFKVDKDMLPSDLSIKKTVAIPKKEMNVADALNHEGYFYELCESAGKISLEYVWAYPPGIPLIVPGEVISEEVINYLKNAKNLKSTKGKIPKIYVK